MPKIKQDSSANFADAKKFFLFNPQSLLMQKVKQNWASKLCWEHFLVKKQPANFADAKKSFLFNPQSLLMQKVKQNWASKLC